MGEEKYTENRYIAKPKKKEDVIIYLDFETYLEGRHHTTPMYRAEPSSSALTRPTES